MYFNERIPTKQTNKQKTEENLKQMLNVTSVKRLSAIELIFTHTDIYTQSGGVQCGLCPKSNSKLRK